jgi:hypothetical protein
MTADDDNDLTGRELEPAFRQGTMPAPHDLVGILRENLHVLVLELRQARGEVHAPEDVYVPVRRLGALAEGLQDYGRAFTKVAGEVREFIQDELEEAVGEQDGVPNSGMRVPDVDGTDLKIELDIRNEYNISLGPVLTGAALFTRENAPGLLGFALADWEMADDGRMLVSEEALLAMMSEGMRTLIACGQFKPQITKVRAMATEIARIDPKTASTITNMLKRAKRTDFRGVKVKREQPK